MPNQTNIGDELREQLRRISVQLLTGTKRDIDMFAETMSRRIQEGVKANNPELMKSVGIGAHLLAEKHKLQARNTSMNFIGTIFQTVANAAILALTGPEGLISGAIGAIDDALSKALPPKQPEDVKEKGLGS